MAFLTVSAFLVIDTDSSSCYYQKYYDHTLSVPHFESEPANDTFLKALYPKIAACSTTDILFLPNNLIAYIRMSDELAFVLIAKDSVSEMAMYSVLEGIYDAAVEMYKPSLDKQTLLAHYDALVVLVNEAIEEGGYILENDAKELVKRVAVHFNAGGSKRISLGDDVAGHLFPMGGGASGSGKGTGTGATAASVVSNTASVLKATAGQAFSSAFQFARDKLGSKN